MSFLHLSALWGLALLSVPILLLLLHRKKLVLYWAAYEWLHAAVIRKRREIEIHDLLKLISKLLLLTAIALLVARPYMHSSTSHGPLLLVLDVSPSMGARLDDGTRLDHAKRLALDLISHHDGPVAVYSFHSALEPVVGKYTWDRGELRDRIGRVAPHAGSGGIVTLIDQIVAGALWTESSRIVVLGDFQDCWYGDGQEVARQIARVGKAHPMTWVQVDDRKGLEHVAITKLGVSSEGVWPGRPAFCDIELRNCMSHESAPRILSLTIDGEEVMREAVRLEALQRRTVTWQVVFRTAGRHTVEAHLDDDVLNSDHMRYAVVDVPKKLRVVAIVPAQGAALFPWDTYVRRALSSALPDAALEYRAISPLGFGSMSLDGVDMVVGVETPCVAGGPIASRIKTFVDRGGGALLFLPGEHADEASGFGLTGRIIVDRRPVDASKLSGTLLSFMREPGLKPGNIGIAQTLVFNGQTNEDVRLYTTAGPVARRVQVGRGFALVFGFTPYPGHGDIQFNPNFVQSMLRAVWDVRNGPAVFSDNGTERMWPLTDLMPDAVYTLAGNTSTYNLMIDGIGDSARLVLPNDFSPGYYTILENGKDRSRFGHNPDITDSMLDPTDAKALAAAIKAGLSFGDEGVLNRGGGSRREFEMLLIILLVCALALEIYAHFIKKPA